MKLRLAALALPTLLAPPALAQGKLWVVDWVSGPGSDFATIQGAVDAAAEDDAILVRTGIYDRFEIDGKSLTIVGDVASGAVQLRNTVTAKSDWVRVVNLGVDQAVLIDGFDVEVRQISNADVFMDVTPIALRDNAGVVQLEDLRVGGSRRLAGAVGTSNCASVSLVRCTIEGGFPTAFGLRSEDSVVAAYGSMFCGGPSGTAGSDFLTCVDQGGAGYGVYLEDSSMFASSCSFEGGDGAHAVDMFMPGPLLGSSGAAGGDAVHLVASTFEWQGSSFRAGFGGLPSSDCPGGPDGDDVVPGPASLYENAEIPRRLDVASPLREGESSPLSFEGEPFDLVFLAASVQPSPGLPLPPFVGRLHVGSPSALFGFGLLTFPGAKTVSVSLDLSPGTDFTVLTLQSAHFGALGDFALGNPTTLVVVDGAF